MGKLDAAVREEGVSALEKFLPVLEELRKLEEERNATLSHPLYERILNKVPINVGMVRAGNWASTVPESLVAEGTRQALLFAMYTLKVDLSDEDQERLIEELQNLRALPDVAPGMEALRARGHRLVAFSNGVEATARTLLERAGILRYLEGVVSVDDLKTFKPDPEVYKYLARRLDRPMSETWLVSGSPRDVTGAKSAGLKAAWIKRSPDAVFDPWGIEPDVIAGDLEELSERLG